MLLLIRETLELEIYVDSISDRSSYLLKCIKDIYELGITNGYPNVKLSRAIITEMLGFFIQSEPKVIDVHDVKFCQTVLPKTYRKRTKVHLLFEDGAVEFNSQDLHLIIDAI
jgi:hypothetical protein